MRRLKLQTGSNIVEFAFVMPLLVILVFGIIDFSIGLYDKAVITNAAREGARSGIVYANTRLTREQVEQVVTNYLNSKLITFGGGIADPTATFTPNRGNGNQQSGDTLTVTVDYRYDYVMISRLFPSLSSLQMQAMSVMRVE